MSRRRGYEFRMAAEDSATVRIFDEIGYSWWGGIDPQQFAEDLDELNVAQLNVHINSPGGDAFGGIAMYNALRQHPARKVVYIDGLAASAASVVAMAGDEIVMNAGSQMMVHDAAGIAIGFALDMEKMASELNKLSDGVAGIYAKRAKGKRDDFRQAMRDESWYTDQEAVEAGLADRIAEDDVSETEEGEKIVARDSRVWKMFRYATRADAPAPRIPARMSAGTEERTEPVTDESMQRIREALGLEADADEEAIVAAVETRAAEGGTTEGESGSAENHLPEGVVMIERSALDELRADALMGREAREEQNRQRRTQRVETAIRLGKVPPARREHWLKALEVDEDGNGRVLDELAEGLVPVSAKGYDAGGTDEDSPSMDLDKVRDMPAYKDWRF